MSLSTDIVKGSVGPKEGRGRLHVVSGDTSVFVWVEDGRVDVWITVKGHSLLPKSL